MNNVVLAILCVIALRRAHVIADCGNTSSIYRISGTQDVSSIATCTTFTGTIAIATDLSGPIAINGPEVIVGSLRANNSQLSAISSNTLREINSTLYLRNLTQLQNVSFPQLTRVTEMVLANLTAEGLDVSFDAGIQQATNVTVLDTTLRDLTGFNIKVAEIVGFVDNHQLTSLSIPVSNLASALVILGNNPALNVSLPNLQWSSNITIWNVSAVSMPVLNYVQGPLVVVYSNVTNLTFPVLTTVTDVVFAYSPLLTTVSLPRLTQVTDEGAYFFKTPKLESLSLTSLNNVPGTINASGAFDGLRLNSLNRAGNIEVSSTNPSFDCPSFDKSLSTVIRPGYLACNGQNQTTSTTSTLTTGTKAGISIGVIAFVALVTAALFFFLYRRRKSRAARAEAKLDREKDVGVPGAELDGSTATAKVELPLSANSDGKDEAVQLPAGDEAVELPSTEEEQIRAEAPVQEKNAPGMEEYDAVAEKPVQKVEGVFEMPERSVSARK